MLDISYKGQDIRWKFESDVRSRETFFCGTDSHVVKVRKKHLSKTDLINKREKIIIIIIK